MNARILQKHNECSQYLKWNRIVYVVGSFMFNLMSVALVKAEIKEIIKIDREIDCWTCPNELG